MRHGFNVFANEIVKSLWYDVWIKTAQTNTHVMKTLLLPAFAAILLLCGCSQQCYILRYKANSYIDPDTVYSKSSYLFRLQADEAECERKAAAFNELHNEQYAYPEYVFKCACKRSFKSENDNL